MSASTPLTREAIQAAQDRPSRRVAVPEWGGHLFVATMGGELRAKYEEHLRAPGGFAKLRAVLVSLTAIDEAGQRLFSDADIDWLHEKSGTALDRVFDVAIRLNRLRKKDLEELEKNSESGPSGSSPSDSH